MADKKPNRPTDPKQQIKETHTRLTASGKKAGATASDILKGIGPAIKNIKKK